MNRPSARRAIPRTPAQLEDTQDLESVMSAALATRPIDEPMLRRGVWTYVEDARQAGTSAGHVILTLTDLIEKAGGSKMEQQAIMRRVILWCVEAYFGRLGGQAHGPAPVDSTQPAESTGEGP